MQRASLLFTFVAAAFCALAGCGGETPAPPVAANPNPPAAEQPARTTPEFPETPKADPAQPATPAPPQPVTPPVSPAPATPAVEPGPPPTTPPPAAANDKQASLVQAQVKECFTALYDGDFDIFTKYSPPQIVAASGGHEKHRQFIQRELGPAIAKTKLESLTFPGPPTFFQTLERDFVIVPMRTVLSMNGGPGVDAIDYVVGAKPAGSENWSYLQASADRSNLRKVYPDFPEGVQMSKSGRVVLPATRGSVIEPAPAPAAAPASTPEELELASIRVEVQANILTYSSGNFAAWLKFCNPTVIDHWGGEDAATARAAAALAEPEFRKVEKVSFSQPPLFLRGAKHEFVFVPTECLVHERGEAERRPRTIVGVKPVGGKSWSYLGADDYGGDFLNLFPDVPKAVQPQEFFVACEWLRQCHSELFAGDVGRFASSHPPQFVEEMGGRATFLHLLKLAVGKRFAGHKLERLVMPAMPTFVKGKEFDFAIVPIQTVSTVGGKRQTVLRHVVHVKSRGGGPGSVWAFLPANKDGSNIRAALPDFPAEVAIPASEDDLLPVVRPTFFERAVGAFVANRGGDAIALCQAAAIVGDAPADWTNGLRWHAATKRTLFATRWGVAQQLPGDSSEARDANYYPSPAFFKIADTLAVRVKSGHCGNFLSAAAAAAGLEAGLDATASEDERVEYRSANFALLPEAPLKELLAIARRERLDYLVVVTTTRRKSKASEIFESNVQLFDANGKQVWEGKAQHAEEPSAKPKRPDADPYVALHDRFVKFLDANTQLAPMPAGLTKENIGPRLTQLAATPPANPLGVLVELTYYREKGLLDKPAWQAAVAKLIGDIPAADLASDDLAVRAKALAAFMPRKEKAVPRPPPIPAPKVPIPEEKPAEYFLPPVRPK